MQKLHRTVPRNCKTKYEASLSGVQAEKEGILNEARGKASNEYDRIVADAQTEAKKILDNAR